MAADFQTKFDIQMLLEQERDLYIASIHDEIDGEDFQAEFVQMKRRWDERMREFELDFFASHVQEKTAKLKRRLHRQKRERKRLTALIEQRELELYQAKGDLEIEQGLTAYLKKSNRCRECNRRL